MSNWHSSMISGSDTKAHGSQKTLTVATSYQPGKAKVSPASEVQPRAMDKDRNYSTEAGIV